MTNRKQLLISGALVLVASAAVTLYAVTGDSNTANAPTSGHEHGATAVAGEAKTVRLDAQTAQRIGVTYTTAEYGEMSTVVRTVVRSPTTRRGWSMSTPRSKGGSSICTSISWARPCVRGSPYSPSIAQCSYPRRKS
jgi:hypothetical protein